MAAARRPAESTDAGAAGDRMALAVWEAIGVAPGVLDERLEAAGPWLACGTPATAAGALRAAGRDAGDLDREDWWFRCRFQVPWQAGSDEELALHFDGIATIADVWLNGDRILSSDNMHRRHRVPLRAPLAGVNELVVGVRALSAADVPTRPRARWRPPIVSDQRLRWHRTTLVGRLPGFAPGPPPVGLWREVALVRHESFVADEPEITTSVDGDLGLVTVRCSIRPLGHFAPETARLVLGGPSGRLEERLELSSAHGSVLLEGRLAVPEAARWWPATHGGQARYSISLLVEGSGVTRAIPCDPVGFRSLDVETEPGLELVVNDVPLFCRGGALLPDAVSLDHAESALRTILVEARDAGMNMIRLPGWGIYGSDLLYRLCDELGLLVWQDLAFANLDYPEDDPSFREEVTREVAEVLARIASHPSLAVVCGNSEVEQQAAMLGLDPSMGRSGLFDSELETLVREHCGDVAYVRSTPSGGDLPFRPSQGVAHYFGVGAYRRPLDDARRAEVVFAAECLAFANVPDPVAAETPRPERGWERGVPRDVGADWDFGDVRDFYLRELFAVEPDGLRAAEPERYEQLSRVVSGEVMAATLGEWRRAKSPCRGALVWTLNDILPGAGWGVLEAAGRPKAPYWYLRRLLGSVAVWLTDEGTNGVAVHIANDGASPLEGVLHVALVRADGVAVAQREARVLVPARSAIERSVEAVLGHFADPGVAYRFGEPAHAVVVAELRTNSRVTRGLHFPLGAPSDRQPAAEIGLVGQAVPAADATYSVTVTAQQLAYAVAVEAPGFVPSDCYFTVIPGTAHTVTLTPTDTCADVEAVQLHPLNADEAVRVVVA